MEKLIDKLVPVESAPSKDHPVPDTGSTAVKAATCN